MNILHVLIWLSLSLSINSVLAVVSEGNTESASFFISGQESPGKLISGDRVERKIPERFGTIFLTGGKRQRNHGKSTTTSVPALDQLTLVNRFDPLPRPSPQTQTPATPTVRKPERSEWILGRRPADKLNLISWLIDGCLRINAANAKPASLPDIKICDVIDDRSSAPEFQSYDGFFNNVFKVDLGAVDTPLLRRVPPAYSDGTYQPVKGSRKNPFTISEELMTRKSDASDGTRRVAYGSKTGKTAFLVYFGQQVVEEVLDAQRAGCPPEYFNIPIPDGHRFKNTSASAEDGTIFSKSEMPFLRSRYAQTTGHSPSNPRQQLNEITPWIDGGLIYGTAKGWADALRVKINGKPAEHGLLASENDEELFPVKNRIRLPLANPPPPAFHRQYIHQHKSANVDRFFVLGNPRGNENAFLLSFGVVLFRWHNQIATYLHHTRPEWSDERVFNEARKWVIATYQSIVLYNWLPEWLGEPMDKYEKYNPTLDPQIEQFFQTAAMRFGHTLVTPGAYMRDYACGGCKPVGFYGRNISAQFNPQEFTSKNAVRTCNIFWRPQEPLTMKYSSSCEDPNIAQDITDIDRLLMGMASQRCEREDNMIVEDLRGNVFGPLEFSRRDLMAVNIQRGRDHGTPDYNTARVALGLDRIKSVDEYMTSTETATPREIVQRMEDIHMDETCHKPEGRCQQIQGPGLGTDDTSDNRQEMMYNLQCLKNCAREEAWDHIDVWTGGILETSDRPGPLFRAIIKDQFTRIRDADRFWFENENWKIPRFTREQIDRIKSLTVYDMVMSVTRMNESDIQANPFRVPNELDDNNKDSDFWENCVNQTDTRWDKSPCYKPVYNQEKLRELLNTTCYHFPQLDSDATPVEPCSPPGTYDYFHGSEIPFILTFSFIGLLVLGIASLVPLLATARQRRTEQELITLQKDLRKSFKIAGYRGTPFAAREWQGAKEGSRAVALILMDNNMLEIHSHKGELLRTIDLGSRSMVEMILISDGKHLVIKNPNEYDCILQFDGPLLRDSFANLLRQRLGGVVDLREQHDTLKRTISTAITKGDRLARLENFFRVVFAQAFNIDKPSGKQDMLNPKLIREVINTELTRAEFADALGMKSKSEFVTKMFDIVDRDKNGYISFREFLDMLVIFAKGSAEDKAQLMFEMYDINRDGKLNTEEFTNMIRSMIEAANADIRNEDVDDLVESMLKSAGVNRNSEVKLADFQQLMSQYKTTLGYAQLNFTGLSVPETQMGAGRKSMYQSARATVMSIYGGNEGDITSDKTSSRLEEDAVLLPPHSQTRNRWSKYIELYRLQIFWTLLYTLVVLAIFFERAYVYSVEREHRGLRHIAGYGVTFTRGAASAMMFCYATLMLTVCRNTITQLRETFLHRIIPFDSSILFHKYVAILGLIFAFIHVIGHGVNFYHISTQTSADATCLFTEYFRAQHIIPKFHYWCFQTTTGITGVLLVVHAALIYIFATNYSRANAFRMFWTTHMTYPLWYVLMIVHGTGQLVQEPIFHNFLLGPLVLFILDHLVTMSRRKIEIPVLRAELLPSNVTKLEFARPTGFDYKSGQWVRIACLALNSNEYHPFTLSSAPHEPSLTVHIRAVGPFTANIRQIYERCSPKLYLDGPYGEGHQDWWRYEVAVLVGGGIGVTPFASILKDVAANANPRNCKKVYFLWVTRTQKQFEWLVDIIRDTEEHKIINVHVFVTQVYDKFDMRTVLLYICERHFQKVSNKSLFTGLRSVTHFGRPNFSSFFRSLRTIHPNVSKFGVFSCGPPTMTKQVNEACIESNNDAQSHGVIFQHRFENF